jgi:hypothetical protein
LRANESQAPDQAPDQISDQISDQIPDQAPEFLEEKAPVALKRAKPRKSRSRKVIDLAARKRAMISQKTGEPHLPSRGQTDTDWLKSILPTPKRGVWWEAPPNDKGFLIKLRWRAGGKKLVYPFARLGKRELETLREMTYEEQRRSLSGRIFGELFDQGRRDLALKLTPYVGGHKVAGAQN